MLEGVSVDPGCTMLPASPQFSLHSVLDYVPPEEYESAY